MKGRNNNKKQREKVLEYGTDYEIIGLIPPQAVDMEEAVLGAMMLDQNAVLAIIDRIIPEMFYLEAHKTIFTAIRNIIKNGDKPGKVDILTVTAELRKMEELDSIGGAYYITRLTNRVSSAAHIEYHAHVVIQKFLQRELISTSSIILKEAYSQSADVFELLDNAERMMMEIRQNHIRKNYKKIDEILTKNIKKLENMKENDGLIGIPSGLTELDRITGGWQKQDLIIFAARPGMGKSIGGVTFAKNAAVTFKKPTAIFSLEMSEESVGFRLMSAEAQLNSEKFKNGRLADWEWQQLNAKIRSLSEAPLYIDDTPALSIFEFRAIVRRMVSQLGIEFVIVDYLQLMEGEGNNRNDEIGSITRGLKLSAKENDIPIMAMAQLSRESEKTMGKDHRPKLSHLRESGSIEQDADIVIFPFRFDYYEEYPTNAHNEDLRGVTEMIVEKNRNGRTGKCNVRHSLEYQMFYDLENTERPKQLELPANLQIEAKSFSLEDNAPSDDLPF